MSEKRFRPGLECVRFLFNPQENQGRREGGEAIEEGGGREGEKGREKGREGKGEKEKDQIPIIHSKL